MIKTTITLLLFIAALKGTAQDPWTLKKCIAYGLSNHRNNKIYTNQKIAADAKAKEMLADYLPKVSITSTLDNNLKLQQSIIPAGVFGPDELKVSFTQKYNSNSFGQLDQVIYDKALLTGLKANKYYAQQADLNIAQSQEAIIYNISTAYFQILIYNQQLELLAYNKEVYEKQIAIYQLQVNSGVTLQKDLDKVMVDYNNSVSQTRVAYSNLKLAENELKYEMGYAIDQPLEVQVLTKTEMPVITGDSSTTFSPSSRIDYKLSQLDIKLLQIDQSRIKAEGLPKLNAYFRYGANGFGNNVKGAYNDLLPYSTAGLKLNISILDFYKRNARYRQAEIKRMNAEENLKLSEGRYRVEYDNTKTKLLQAEVNVENDQRTIELAQSVFQVTDLQFQKGTTDLTDWLNTQHSLKDAQAAYLNSLYTYYKARIDLEKAAGSLKTFYKSL